ncbi:HAMP domain-containing sensor histidine kinase [uncultured Shimia sp.]|uniref:sensor histidine kinase n=1 Tax=uncultured Shimia sp. TaxID=573152 RepID=UPI0026106D7D|nr:HAMP domain-containing sensor histidine kinase [uncultured Shimia sp.]
MRIGSLSLRLLLAAGISTVAALIITAVAISYLFEVYFQKRLLDELRADLTQLTAVLAVQEDGTLDVNELGDLRYGQPFGGRYWQIQYGNTPPLLSRSLWDQALDVSLPETLGATQATTVTAPFGTELLVLSWRITIDGIDAPDGIAISVATDLSELNAASAQFRSNIIFWLMLLGTALILAAWLQVRIGLKPLEQIRTDLENVSQRDSGQLPSGYPTEVRPLVETINAQLSRQTTNLENARRRSSDLAHGLKTPLTVLAAHADEIGAEGNHERAHQISSQIASMRFFVERELARSRVSQSDRLSSNLKKSTVEMVEAIRKLPGADSIEWIVDVPAGINVPSDEHDLSELLGNLLDNARKYATSKVTISAHETHERVVLQIVDDGPGLSEEELGQVTQPGRQGADSVGGYGLGLAIVMDILDLQHGKLELANTSGAGLNSTVSWDRSINPASRH